MANDAKTIETMTPDELKIMVGLKQQECDDLNKQLNELQTELAGVYYTNAALQEEIEKFTKGQQSTVNGQPPTANSQPLQASTFELDGQKYGFHFPATKFMGNLITHVEIAGDEVLQRALLKIKAGILKKLD